MAFSFSVLIDLCNLIFPKKITKIKPLEPYTTTITSTKSHNNIQGFFNLKPIKTHYNDIVAKSEGAMAPLAPRFCRPCCRIAIVS